jgi:hypothetical protein
MSKHALPLHPRRRAYAALLALASGCASSELIEPEIDREVVEFKYAAVGSTPMIDVLLVLDDSPRSAANHAQRAAALEGLSQALSRPTGDGWVPGDIQVGVITTDAGCGGDDRGDDGDLQAERHLVEVDAAGRPVDMGGEACPMLGGNQYLSTIGTPEGTRVQNFTGAIDEAIACVAAVGADGCAFDQPLEAIRRALTKARDGTGNRGFLRDHASLLVVIVTDQDDCSAGAPTLFAPDDDALGRRDAFRCFEHGVTCDQPTREPGALEGPDPAVTLTGCVPSGAPDGPVAPVQPYIDFLRDELKDDPRDVYVAVVAGAGELAGAPAEVVVERQGDQGPHPGWFGLAPSCQGGDPDGAPAETPAASPAVRLDAIRRAFPDRNASLPFCDSNVADVLGGVFRPPGHVVGNPCFQSPLVDAEPATPGLQAECAVTIDHQLGGALRTLPQCDADGSNPPCWRIEASAECSSPATGDAVLGFLWDGPAPLNQVVRGQCVVTGD